MRSKLAKFQNIVYIYHTILIFMTLWVMTKFTLDGAEPNCCLKLIEIEISFVNDSIPLGNI